jgi:7-carboxy-7-deazaguanine synthase
MQIKINDIYAAIQGEGVHTGVPMVILRLQGCTVGCPFCDTKETWEIGAADEQSNVDETLGVNPRWVSLTANDAAAYIKDRYESFKWVMVTGGEPGEQALAPLVNALHDRDYFVALETSGTTDTHRDAGFDWVCVSPKFDMPGGKTVVPAVLEAANEIKHVVGKRAHIDQLDAILATLSLLPTTEICLQPMSMNPEATRLCVQTVQARGWRLSIQVHKYLDLP